MNRSLFLCLMLGCTAALGAGTGQSPGFNFSPGIGAPITTSVAESLKRGEWSLSQRSEYLEYGPLSDEQLLSDVTASSINANFSHYLIANYGLTDHITTGIAFSYSGTNTVREAEADPFLPKALLPDTLMHHTPHVLSLGSPTGIGDTKIYSLWNFFNNQHKLSLALLSGIIAPTGKDNLRTVDGTVFRTEDQPGAGAWSPFAGLFLTKKWKKSSFSANLVGVQSNEGAQKTTLGSIINYNLALTLKAYSAQKSKLEITGVVELNGELLTPTRVAGFVDPHSGGSYLFLTPGIRIDAAHSTSIYGGLNIPIAEQVRGLQVKSTIGFTAGIDWVV